jgi:putative PIN family toxin of toxin-antitoxin system
VKAGVVFDTTVVVSALVFQGGQLAWLRVHWREGRCVPIASRYTVAELVRILRYPKFRLTIERQHELLADYLPYCEIIDVVRKGVIVCRDPKDQPFLDLAQSGKAESLVSGDRDLLVLAGQTEFLIESPEEYRCRALTE